MPLTLLTMMAVGILYVRLRHGPIAFDFVVAPIERGINAELTYEFREDRWRGTEAWHRPANSNSGLRDVSVLEQGGDVVLSSPLAAVNISMAALMRGRIVPARIELIDPIIALAYSEKSGFVFERAIPQPTSRRVRQRAPAAAVPPPAPAANTTVATRTVADGTQSQSDEDAERFVAPRPPTARCDVLPDGIRPFERHRRRRLRRSTQFLAH